LDQVGVWRCKTNAIGDLRFQLAVSLFFGSCGCAGVEAVSSTEEYYCTLVFDNTRHRFLFGVATRQSFSLL
jgi:hypothetical protein